MLLVVQASLVSYQFIQIIVLSQKLRIMQVFETNHDGVKILIYMVEIVLYHFECFIR